jgi:hypothetical protein
MEQSKLGPRELADTLNGILDGSYEPPQPPAVDFESIALFGGLEGINLNGKRFVITEGIELAPTFAHCFSYFMAAFAPPPTPRAPHPPPWHALRGGGVSFDIGAELIIKESTPNFGLTRVETLNLVMALMRLLSGLTPRTPMISDQSFSDVLESQKQPNVFAWETLPFGYRTTVEVTDSFASGLGECLPRAARLLAVPEFRRSFQLFDAVTWLPTSAARLTAIWTAIETAIRPGRRNIAKNLARCLGDLIGEDRTERDRICNQALKLYGERGSSAHDSQDADFGAIRESQMLARSMFIRIISNEQMP